ncbi:MAG: glutathione S-transferase C-terminal domain-containing protein, partial [Alphaproteobacteria bacterium]|nr:glutathione S-transferase C-terminal domain-containing protein [Alphaproteobacteria bacterium]
DARAHARSVAAEMHSGFGDLRAAMPMNLRRDGKPVALGDAAKAQVARVQAIWKECRGRAGASGGPFLFGRFSVADAMFAPVACRFRSYGTPLDPVCAAYVRAIVELPAMQAWRDAAAAEPWTMPKYDSL